MQSHRSVVGLYAPPVACVPTQSLVRVFALAFLCCMLSVVSPRAASAQVDDRPIVVLRIDDCVTTWLTPYTGLGGVNGLSYGKTKHIPITWAVITSQASAGTSLTWAQLTDYMSVAGGELASHSANHSPMPSQAAYIDELVASKAAIEANAPGCQCRTFLQPGTWVDDAYMDLFPELDNPIGQAVQANYAQSMAYLGGGYSIGNVYYRYGGTPTVNIDAQSNPSIPALNADLDMVAATPGLIYVITGHGVQEQGQKTTYRIGADILKAYMDKLASLRDEGKIRLMSMNDAYQATFSPNLNRVPCPGFELTNPAASTEPWKLSSGAQIIASGGRSDSKYCSLPVGYAVASTRAMVIPPGRYELSWYQKAASAAQNTAVVVYSQCYTTPNITTEDSVNWAFYYNSSPTTWEKKTALVHISEKMNQSTLLFETVTNGSYGIDDIAIIPAPLDPAVSPTSSTATPASGQCTVSWHTPASTQWTGTIIRYSKTAYPLTPTSGKAFGNKVTAVRDTTQQLTAPVDWNTDTQAHFSVFAVDDSGHYSAPDLVVVPSDVPPTPQSSVSIVPVRRVNAAWTCTGAKSTIVGSQYAVGRSPQGQDVVAWTSTPLTSAQLTNLGAVGNLYLSVKCQNIFGRWSSVSSTLFSLAASDSITDSLKHQDGSQAAITGIVSAVFSDCYYVEETARTRGLKVMGAPSSSEGTEVTVSGTLTTTASGERALLPDP